jgi:large subunit ribosomal protein L9
MIVILKSDVKDLGKKGDKVNVADGYGRNFLIPRGLAYIADEGALQQHAVRESQKASKAKRDLERATRLAQELEGIVLVITAKCGEGGKLFGSVTNVQIAEELNKQKGHSIDRKRIEIKETIKTVGPHTATIHIYQGISASITVLINPM